MTRWLPGAVLACVGALAVPRTSNAEDNDDPKPQCLLASEEGQDQRDDGHYRAAHESFVVCARDVCPQVIRQWCAKWLRDVEQDTPTIVLGAKDALGNDLTDVNVSLDGAPFATQLDGKPLEADRGEHVLRFERTGSAPIEQKVVLRAGERARDVTVTFPGETEPSKSSAPPSTTVATPARVLLAEPLFSSRHVATGAIALGAIGAGAAGVLFVIESGQDKDAAAGLRSGLASNACAHAPTTATCQSLSDKVAAQHHETTIATVLFAGAGALAASAAVTWLLWPHAQSSQSQATAWIAATPGGAMLHLRHSFR